MPLTERQGKVLVFLANDCNGITNRKIVSDTTGIALGTVKDCIYMLEKEGYISHIEPYAKHRFRGIKYTLNKNISHNYIEKINQSLNQSHDQSLNQLLNQLLNQTVTKPVTPFSSKVLKEDLNLTTKTDIFEDPELKFWKGEGVTEKQIQNWMTEFQLNQDEIVMSLRYGRFDILERGDVNNSANWFYKILTRNGFYPKPANYRSLLEIKAEALQQQQERDRAAKAQIEATELETKFQTFLSDTEAPLYQELIVRVSDFAKEQLKDGERMAVDIELKELFKKCLKSEVFL